MVELAPEARAALFGKARNLGVKEGSLEHRILVRELQRTEKQITVARAREFVLAEMQEAALVEKARADRRSKIAKARLAKKGASPTKKALRSHKLGRAAALVERIGKTLTEGKVHRSSIAADRQKVAAKVRREKSLVASYRMR